MCPSMLDAFAAQIGAPFALVSAQTGSNVYEAFDEARKVILRHESYRDQAARTSGGGGFSLRRLLSKLFGGQA